MAPTPPKEPVQVGAAALADVHLWLPVAGGKPGLQLHSTSPQTVLVDPEVKVCWDSCALLRQTLFCLQALLFTQHVGALKLSRLIISEGETNWIPIKADLFKWDVTTHLKFWETKNYGGVPELFLDAKLWRSIYEAHPDPCQPQGLHSPCN